MGDLELFFKGIVANKGKRLSFQYLHTYNLFYFHIDTGDAYDEPQGHFTTLHNLFAVHLSLILRAGIPSEAVSLLGTQTICVLKWSL